MVRQFMSEITEKSFFFCNLCTVQVNYTWEYIEQLWLIQFSQGKTMHMGCQGITVMSSL